HTNGPELPCGRRTAFCSQIKNEPKIMMRFAVFRINRRICWVLIDEAARSRFDCGSKIIPSNDKDIGFGRINNRDDSCEVRTIRVGEYFASVGLRGKGVAHSL